MGPIPRGVGHADGAGKPRAPADAQAVRRRRDEKALPRGGGTPFPAPLRGMALLEAEVRVLQRVKAGGDAGYAGSARLSTPADGRVWVCEGRVGHRKTENRAGYER